MQKYLVLDLEMCTQQIKRKYCKGYRESETIQIGAVKLDENFEIIDKYMSYVRPEFVDISPVIQKMTGITNERVKTEPMFREVIYDFGKWIGPDKLITISWSRCDERQLRNEMRNKKYFNPRIEKLFRNWEDCQEIFRRVVKADHCISLGKALELAETAREGQDHDALTDSINTAALFKQIMKKELPYIEIDPLPETTQCPK